MKQATFASLFVLLLACSSSSSSSSSQPPTGSLADAGVAETGAGPSCTAALDQLLVPVDRVATAQVAVVSQEGGVTTVYVDASAGGFDQARRNPRVYITLAGERVDVTDRTAPSSVAWDLALKRQVLFTNSGDTGIGGGGAQRVDKDFQAVTAADGDGLRPESLFDAECNPLRDAIEDPETTFTGWYDYDTARMRASPRPGTSFVVRSAAGVLHKVAIVSYTGRPDGSTTAPSTGFYLLRIAKL